MLFFSPIHFFALVCGGAVCVALTVVDVCRVSCVPCIVSVLCARVCFSVVLVCVRVSIVVCVGCLHVWCVVCMVLGTLCMG